MRSAPRSTKNCAIGNPRSPNCVTAWKMAVCPPTPASSTVGARVDVRAAIEQSLRGFDNAELRGHVQQGRPWSRRRRRARAAAIQFRKPPVRQRWIGIESLRQTIEPAAEHFQHARSVVLVVPPALSRRSMQALSRSGDRA